jgi:hypothetical protein
MREHVIQIVEKYIDAIRSNGASAVPLHPDAEYIHVSNGEIVSIRGYCDPRPMLSGANTSA